MNAQPRVSVIVPVYNVAKYLRAALDSLVAAAERLEGVRGQESGVRVEVICVDDGSTDGSGEILNQYASSLLNSPNFLVFHQPNAGVSAARNAGLDRATGEIIAFLDPDDLVEPDWLVKLADGIRDVDYVWGGMTIESEKGRSPHLPDDVGSVYEGDAVRRRVWRAVFGYRLRDLFWMAFPGGMWRHCHRELSAVMCRAYRRSVLGDLRFDTRVRLGEDATFLAAFALRAKSMRVIGDTGYRYFVRPSGAMISERRNRMVPCKFGMRDIRRELDPKMTHWRGTFLLSALEVLRIGGIKTAVRYVRGRGVS